MQKILIADKNRLLREMLTRAVLTDDNLEIVSISDSIENLYMQVMENDPDWVIISLPHNQEQLPDEVKQILLNSPETGVLIISPDGRHISAKWFEMHERTLDGINLNELLELLSQPVVYA